MERNNRFFSRWLKLIGYLGFVLLLFLLISSSKVKKVECVVDGKAADDFCNNLQFFKGKSLFFVDFLNDESLSNLLSSSDQIYSYYVDDIEKNMSGTLMVKLTRQEPLYRLVKGDESYLVSEDGKFKKDLPDLKATKVTTGPDWKEEWTHGFISSLVIESRKHNIFFKEINLKSLSEVVLITDKNRKLILEKNNEVEREVERMALLLNNLNLESFEKNIREIDMRFDFPVLRE